MSTLMADCPRCMAARTTFDVSVANFMYQEYSWQDWYEVPAVCRHCNRITTFLISLNNVNNGRVFRQADAWSNAYHLNEYFSVDGFVTVKENAPVRPPEHVPPEITAIFDEGASCLSVNCYNAAGAMFRLALDMTTKSLLPAEAEQGGPNRQQRTRLYDRLGWLFDNRVLPEALREIADCVREDGNDAAHDGTLAKADAEDLLDFSRVLLERVYTEPKRLEEAKARRLERRGI